MSYIKEFFGNKVKELRIQKGFTQDQFGQLTGLTRTSVLNLERGRQSPTIERLFTICEILHCTPNDLFPNHQKMEFEMVVEMVPVTKLKKKVTYEIKKSS